MNHKEKRVVIFQKYSEVTFLTLRVENQSGGFESRNDAVFLVLDDQEKAAVRSTSPDEVSRFVKYMQSINSSAADSTYVCLYVCLRARKGTKEAVSREVAQSSKYCSQEKLGCKEILMIVLRGNL